MDSWLLELFPGKTLEELDGVDFGRLLRALAARETVRVETLRELHRQRKAKPTAAEWQAIQRHDRLVGAASTNNSDANSDAT